jgi:hypothetical protein
MLVLARLLGSLVGAAGIILVGFVVAERQGLAIVHWPWSEGYTQETSGELAPSGTAAKATIESLRRSLAESGSINATSVAEAATREAERMFETGLTATAERDQARSTIEALQTRVVANELGTRTTVQTQDDSPSIEQREEPTPGPPVSRTFLSQSHGFRVSWNERWDVAHRESSPTSAFDQIVLTNGSSDVAFTETTIYTGDVQQCVEGVVDGIRASTTSGDVQPVGLAEDLALPIGDRAQLTEAYAYTSSADGVRTPRIAQITCVVLIEGESNLIILQSASVGEFLDELPVRNALISALELPD